MTAARRLPQKGKKMGRIIEGRYERDDNFTTVYVDEEKALYTIARNTGEWARMKVGDVLHVGGVLTQADYDRMSEGLPVGRFELQDIEEEEY